MDNNNNINAYKGIVLYYNEFTISISTSTVKRRFRDAGLLGSVAKKNPYLRLANKRKRLRWAKEHRHWTEDD